MEPGAVSRLRRMFIHYIWVPRTAARDAKVGDVPGMPLWQRARLYSSRALCAEGTRSVAS